MGKDIINDLKVCWINQLLEGDDAFPFSLREIHEACGSKRDFSTSAKEFFSAYEYIEGRNYVKEVRHEERFSTVSGGNPKKQRKMTPISTKIHSKNPDFDPNFTEIKYNNEGEFDENHGNFEKNVLTKNINISTLSETIEAGEKKDYFEDESVLINYQKDGSNLVKFEDKNDQKNIKSKGFPQKPWKTNLGGRPTTEYFVDLKTALAYAINKDRSKGNQVVGMLLDIIEYLRTEEAAAAILRRSKYLVMNDDMQKEFRSMVRDMVYRPFPGMIKAGVPKRRIRIHVEKEENGRVYVVEQPESIMTWNLIGYRANATVCYSMKINMLNRGSPLEQLDSEKLDFFEKENFELFGKLGWHEEVGYDAILEWGMSLIQEKKYQTALPAPTESKPLIEDHTTKKQLALPEPVMNSMSIDSHKIMAEKAEKEFREEKMFQEARKKYEAEQKREANKTCLTHMCFIGCRACDSFPLPWQPDWYKGICVETCHEDKSYKDCRFRDEEETGDPWCPYCWDMCLKYKYYEICKDRDKCDRYIWDSFMIKDVMELQNMTEEEAFKAIFSADPAINPGEANWENHRKYFPNH
jgi:hypothetical protein